MSDTQSTKDTALVKVRELRGLLLDYIAGGPARAPRYKELRDELLAEEQLNGQLPVLVAAHENLSDLWQFLKYQSPSKVERQEFIRSEFDALADTLSGAPVRQTADFKAIPMDKLFKGWYRLSQDTMEPRQLLSTAHKIAVQVCCSIVDAHYNSNEIRGDNQELSQVFGMTKDVLFACCAETDKQQIVTQTVTGAAALLKAFDHILERMKQATLPPDVRLSLARLGVDSILSAVLSLLSCWNMLESLPARK